jgi:hypothetical protein
MQVIAPFPAPRLQLLERGVFDLGARSRHISSAVLDWEDRRSL